jgi:dCTP deaminase
MAVLGRGAILEAIEQGAITITPFDPELVGPASVDLTLAPSFRVFRKVHAVIDVGEDTDYRQLTDKIVVPGGGHILIMPGETVLSITRERLRLGPGLCGWLEGRSRFARLGLMVHISAPFMGPGIDSQQVLEMSNFGPAPLAVHPGTAICQFVFQKLEGMESYAGRYAGHTEDSFRAARSTPTNRPQPSRRSQVAASRAAFSWPCR